MRTRIRTAGLAAAAIALAAAGVSPTAKACGTEPVLGEVCLFAFDFCPQGYIPAAGQLLAIDQFEALYSLYGGIYGGDGRSSFGVPDLRGRVPIHLSDVPGRPYIPFGGYGGEAQITLTENQLPVHTHAVSGVPITLTARLIGTSEQADGVSPTGALLAATLGSTYSAGTGSTVAMNADSVNVAGRVSGTTGSVGASRPIDNMQPYLPLRYCVAITGRYPSRG